MKLVITHSYEESAALCAEIMNEVFRKKPDALMGLATGSTPVPVYEKMVEAHRAGTVDYSKARSINLDEYIGLAGSDPNSYLYFMRTNLFDRVGMSLHNVWIPDGMKPVEEELARLNGYLDSHEIEIQLLSVGTNGHIGFNEPDDVFYDKYHAVDLTEETRRSNSRLFSSIEVVPRAAITMGIGGIMRAKQIAFLATGGEKLRAMKAVLEKGNVTPKVQGTVLKLHRDCTIFLDRALAQQITPDRGVEVIYK